MFEAMTVLFLLAAIFNIVNERFLRLEKTIGLMLLALLLVCFLYILGFFGANVLKSGFTQLLTNINFSQVVLQGMLCFLLFAGAMNVSLRALKEYKWDVIVLAMVGTLVAVSIIATLCWYTLNFIGIKINYLWALIFGTIVSPTDPIAALSILKSMGLPEKLEVIIDGESQFNDGIGVVLFATLTAIAFGHASPSFSSTVTLFAKEVVGGVGLGILMSVLTHYFLRATKVVTTQAIVTLAAVSSTYAVAEYFEISGPIACVILGLIVGKHSIRGEFFAKSKDQISFFWNLINQILTAILFILLGLVALRLNINNVTGLMTVFTAIVAVLIGRFVSVYFSMLILGLRRKYNLHSRIQLASLMTWAGLRGALAVALVLSLPQSSERHLLVPMTYGVVVFSIIFQGLTIQKFFSVKSLRAILKSGEIS